MENSTFRAMVNEKNCFGNGDCIKVCKVKAIEEGPKILPMQCGATELLPGKAIINGEICNGCGDCVAVCSYHAIEMRLLT